MGCSPSKGQLFSKKSPPQELQSNAVLEELAETEIQDNILTIQGKKSSVCDVACDAAVTVEEDGPEVDVDVVLKGGSQDGQTAQDGFLGNKKKGTDEINTKLKHEKRKKLRKQRLRETSCVQSKAEFILKARQAVCAYLNPSITRYESLLELLDQAAQTRSSLQSTVTSVILYYEEINQALEEMAADGEQMLWEHGHYMTWPALLKDCPPTVSKPNNDLNTSNVPSEMFQQMLLHSTLKMVSVGDSVRCLGDSALQELADYFDSSSQLVGEKLLAKRAAECRLKQVLTRVEAAALNKGSPEDSALHSEDSGIGADNECQTGSEHLRRHRNSSGSNVGTTSVCTTSSSPDQQLINDNEEVTENDDDNDDDDDAEDNDAEIEVSTRDEQITDKMRGTTCGSSEVHHLYGEGLQIHDQVNRNVKRNTRRPKTADNSGHMKLKHRHLRGPKRSQSTECLCDKMEDFALNEQQKTMQNKKTLDEYLPGEPRGHVQRKIRRHSSGGQNAVRSYGLQYGSKGPFRATPPNSPPRYIPEPRGRHAVKRLINTFSQGMEGNCRQDQIPSKVKENKKSFLPLLLKSRGALTTNAGTRLPEPRPEHLDLDSLPPPPPEMLIEFERSVTLPSEGSQWAQCASQKRENVASNKANMQQGSMSYSAARPVRQDALVDTCTNQDYNKTLELDSEREDVFKKHFSKHVYLPDLPAESITKINGKTCRSPPPQGCDGHNKGDVTTRHSKFVPPTTPPVSRARLPPSCPTVHHAVASPPSSVLTPSDKWTPSTTQTTSSIHRLAVTEKNYPSDSISQSFSETRAMFCPDNQLVPHTWTPSCTSTLPRPWGEPAKRKMPTAFMRCSPSGHRSSHSEKQQLLSIVKQQHDQGNDVTTDGTNIISVLSEGRRCDLGGTDQDQHTAHLNTLSMLEGEEDLTD